MKGGRREPRALRRAIAAALLLWGGVAGAQSATDFTVGDIRVEGLQRISEGTVYNYLPVNIGDRLDARHVQEAIRALFATGFFSDIELRRDGATLVVVVRERPSIESFQLSGNKDLQTEDLQKSLRSVGLATGKTFDRSVLEEVRSFLTDQYFSRGKYAVRIDPQVEEVPGNKVRIKIDIVEGQRAKIRQINLVGNTAYDDEELLDELELKTPGWLSWYKQDDRYSRESLQGDLEKLTSYYQDRGYANFAVESTQVAIAPEMDDIFITMNLHEGDVYKVGEVKLAGTMKVPEEQLKRLLLVKSGQTYSRKLITQSQELISYRLGADGYAFAKIDPVPTAHEDTKTVDLTFFVDAGNRAYVRRINFINTSAIDDEVLRRELRQMEGSYLSNALLERSKERLQRLPYIEKVEYETTPVPGTPDLVDVDYDIKEGLPGQFSGGVGYSESQGIMLNGSFVHSNFMGSGERVGLELVAGKYSKSYSLTHTDPYTTIDNVSRTIGLQYRDVTQYVSAASDFSTTTMSGTLEYGYPITEYQGLRFGLIAQRSDLIVNPTSSAREAVDWVRANGNPYTRVIEREIPPTDPDDDPIVLTTTLFGTKFDTLEAVASWYYDSRNRAIFADRGLQHSLSFAVTAPGSEVDYYTVRYDYLQLLPIWRQWTVALAANIAYGDALGKDTTSLPPYRQFFAGGPDTVRGFAESRLGPKDSFGNPYGGNLKVVGRAELLFPVPDKWRGSTRISAFYDIGNVFSQGTGIRFVGLDGRTPVDYEFDYNELKQSAGLAIQWFAPLGIFRFSYGFPLNEFKGDGIRYPDEVERFQFTIGSAF
ncbi:MAG TPA: outer membrane protein assembly factor BamA [Steroidobacteraceae bacterium]|nr:outer membrane protein assembly factor BamA [Steroidobacteraceae bacterium]